MWIERLNIIGFGGIANQEVTFTNNALNVIVAANEYGKSTIAEAILATLYDFPSRQRNSDDRLKDREAKRPAKFTKHGNFKVCMEVIHRNRRLRVVRDFAEKTLKVFDVTAGDKEVTKEFLVGPSDDDLGFAMTGMSRELFTSTSFVGQRELDVMSLGETHDLSSLFQSIADSSGGTTTAASAIAVLDDLLNKFPYKDRKARIEKVIQDLEAESMTLDDRIRQYEEDKNLVAHDIETLSKLEEKISKQQNQIKNVEYKNLQEELSEVESRLTRAQERLIYVGKLKEQLAQVQDQANFPVKMVRSVDELWTKRQSRLEDRQRLMHDLSSKQQDANLRHLEVRERYDGIWQFSVDDAQTISGLAHTLKAVVPELRTFLQKRQDEHKKVKEQGVDLDSLDGIRKILLGLETRDVDEAFVLFNDLSSTKKQISEIEGSVWRNRALRAETLEHAKIQIVSTRNNAKLLGFLIVLMIAIITIMVTVLKMSFQNNYVLAAAITLCGVIGFAIANFIHLSQSSKEQEQYERNCANEDKEQESLGQELNAKAMGLEVRFEDFARKAGVSSGAELMKLMESYASVSGQLKELDFIDQVIASREHHIAQLKSELEPYFVKAGRKAEEIAASTALALSDDIYRWTEEERVIVSGIKMLEHQNSEVQFMNDELLDIDSLLRDIFTKSFIAEHESIENAYEVFKSQEEKFRRFENLNQELKRLSQDTTSDLVANELPGIINKLTRQRLAILDRLEVLDANSLRLQPDKTASDRKTTGQFFAYDDSLVSEMKQREELLIKVRTKTRDYDENYLTTLEQLESVKDDLRRIKHTKLSLELAREKFVALAKETHLHWSTRLNEISKDMLATIGTDFESIHFDNDLRLTARRRGMAEPLQPPQIRSQLSSGTREQLHLIARLVIARFLSQDEPLPLIMDEPFSELDDKRFDKMMLFLAESLSKQHQVILFSCHEKRFQELSQALSDKQRLHFTGLKTLVASETQV
jgi:DNA repair exonuclease SbcCD ATPase subunit